MLLDSWEIFRTSLSNFAAYGTIIMKLARCNILNEEMKRNSQGLSSHSDVFVTDRERSQSRGPSNKEKHRNNSKGKFVDYVCNNRGKKGHTIRYYKQLKKNENKKVNYNNKKNNRMDDDGRNDTLKFPATKEFFICCDYDMETL
ncbi:hypothetical protein LXL04_008892 [Taraxacum kok-saghyz]